MTKINSLYSLIKKISQEKGRPLKIVCDWDEVLKPMKVWMVYGKTDKQTPFEDFFQKYWANAEMVRYNETGETHSAVKLAESVANNKNFTMCKSSFCSTCEDLKEDMKSDPDFYKKSFFLSPAEELLITLKEDLISELVIISAYRISKYKHTKGDPRKREMFAKTFGKFPNTKIDLIGLQKNEKGVSQGKTSPLRWQWIHDNHSNFDLYIDDDVRSILRTRDKALEKNYVLPNYKESMKAQAPNIYHVKTTVSDIQPIHFAIGALEYRTNKLEQKIQELKINRSESKPSSPTPIWLIAFPAISIVLALLVWIVVWKRKTKLNLN